MNISASAVFKGTASLGTTLTSSGIAAGYSTKNSSLSVEIGKKDQTISEDKEFTDELQELMKNTEVDVFDWGKTETKKCKHWDEDAQQQYKE